MKKIIINGGIPLHGKVTVEGSKNSALPILAATVLCRDICVIQNCPDISDVYYVIESLRHLGCRVTWENHTVLVDARDCCCDTVPSEMTTQLRASVLFMGALLGRNRHAVIGMPGGCKIGSRPIDLHLNGFRELGVIVEEENGQYLCDGRQMHGTTVRLTYPSVGATENLLLASVLTDGVTCIENAAREPEIGDLILFLNRMGAEIQGQGTDVLTIRGVAALHGTVYRLPYDRIVAATYALASTITGGDIVLEGIDDTGRIENILPVIGRYGTGIERLKSGLRFHTEVRPQAQPVTTDPYPGIPTDIQSMLLAVSGIADGRSQIIEHVFEARYQVVPELVRMGAVILVSNQRAVVLGVDTLYGTEVYATDLRAGAALVLAGLAAQGQTVIHNVSYIERGYEQLVENLNQLGGLVRYSD
ncbi:MAG: UDP-N-acetylglucosamine 1-carboxyvinyltransferase [Lachnospiraceae bacterium]